MVAARRIKDLGNAGSFLNTFGLLMPFLNAIISIIAQFVIVLTAYRQIHNINLALNFLAAAVELTN